MKQATWKKTLAMGLALALTLTFSPLQDGKMGEAATDKNIVLREGTLTSSVEVAQSRDGLPRTENGGRADSSEVAEKATTGVLSTADAATGGATSGGAVEPEQTAKPDDDKPDIGEEGFDEDSHLRYEVTDELGDMVGVVITGYDSEYYEKIDTVTIPETIDDYPVRFIGDYAFEESKFKKIELPSYLEKIGYYAFSNCSKLKSIDIPASVIVISNGAFSYCSKLKSVTFKGNKIGEIKYNTFDNCKKLEKIDVPSSVREIGERAFYNCTKLGKVTLGNKVESIARSAFAYNFALTSMIIPASVKSIEDSAFYHCSGMYSITLKGKSTTIGKSCFSGCESLQKFKLSDKMKDVPDAAFCNCHSLRKVKLSKNTKLIKKNAFKNCVSLKKIKLKKKIYGIIDGAFSGSGLKKIQFNTGLQYIGNAAFMDTALKKVTLTKKVSYIGSNVFAGCRSLGSIVIPANVKGVSPNALNNCTSLKSITVAAGNANYCSQNGVLFDKAKTTLLQYPIGKSGSSYTVPSTVAVVRSHAFEGNKKLESVSVSAEKIHNHAFSDMQNLKRVTIGSGVKNIATEAFSDNGKLGTVEMSDSVRVIANRAFADSAIKSFKIPSSLTSFASSALDGCNKLEAYEGSGTGRYPVIDGVLYQNNGTVLRNYPCKKKDKTFTVPEKVTKVLSDGFDRVKSLKKLYFQSGIKYLSSGCISNCNNLKEIVFAEGTHLSSGWSAVYNCDRLAVIVGPRQSILESMADYADAALITL